MSGSCWHRRCDALGAAVDHRKVAGLGDGFSAHSPRVGMAQDLSAAGAELPELMTAGRWDSPTMPARYTEAQAAGRGAVAQYYRGACGVRGQRRGRQVSNMATLIHTSRGRHDRRLLACSS